jgi:hypothetical protein
MIFNSPEFEKLNSQYSDAPDYDVPYVIFLYRKNRFADERMLLDECFSAVSLEKQKDWLGRLCSPSEEQFLGAWFEIMLMNWLRPAGEIKVEPEILSSKPDFLVRKGDKEIIIEAKALLVSRSEREQRQWKSAIFSSLEEIRLPYMLIVEEAKLVGPPDTSKLTQEVRNWLISQPGSKYIFEDSIGNIVVFTCKNYPTLSSVDLVWSGEAQWLNPDLIKPALKEKAKSNKGIRKAGYPYIIALFIEDFLYSAEEVVRAWFGDEVVVIDTNKLEVIETKRNLRGLHLYRKQISHRTVSGTLVMKIKQTPNFRGRLLEGRYIENPYAKVKVDASIFPVEASFVVSEQDAKGYKMTWKHN